MTDEFHRTPMGRKFYEHDLPNLIHQLERIANCLEKPVALAEPVSVIVEEKPHE